MYQILCAICMSYILYIPCPSKPEENVGFMEKNCFFGTNPRFQKSRVSRCSQCSTVREIPTCDFLSVSRSANTLYNNRHHKRAYIHRFLVEFATDLQSVLWLNHTHIEFIEGSIEVAQLSNFPCLVLIPYLVCRTNLSKKCSRSVHTGPSKPMIFLLENHG